MAQMAGKPPPPAPARLQELRDRRAARAERQRARGVDIDAVHKSKTHDETLESHVIKGAWEILEQHPRVLLAVRQNSGAIPYDRDGKPVPVWFYKLVRTPEKLTIVDFWGFLRDGKPFAFECKRPSWKRQKNDDREDKQAAFLNMIECLGGIARFVNDAEQVAQALQ